MPEIDREDPTDYAPAVVTTLAMPLMFSIGNGIAFISFTGIKILAGKWREAGLTMIVLALLFAVRYALLAGTSKILCESWNFPQRSRVLCRAAVSRQEFGKTWSRNLLQPIVGKRY